VHDKEYMDAVDDAIKRGTPPPSRNTELNHVPKLDEFVGLSDSAINSSDDTQRDIADDEHKITLDEFREKVFELRGRKA
jgi:hypothetical protein